MLSMVWTPNGPQVPTPQPPPPTRLRLTSRGFVSK
jgi:hypothetical protein